MKHLAVNNVFGTWQSQFGRCSLMESPVISKDFQINAFDLSWGL